MLLLVGAACSDAETSELEPEVRDNVQIPSGTNAETGCVMIERKSPAGKLYTPLTLPSWFAVVWRLECTSLPRVTLVDRREATKLQKMHGIYLVEPKRTLTLHLVCLTK